MYLLIKKLKIIILLIILSFTVGTCVNTANNNTNAGVKEFKLATWNIRILSDGSRDDTELSEIASIIKRYDIVAIQEARDTTVLNRLKNMLPGYDYIVSSPVGSSVKELYTYFYKTSIFKRIGTPYLYVESDDEFIREPFVACFKAGNFDFTLVEIHVIYGDTITERRAEVSLLDDVIQSVRNADGGEKDIILVGDFNLDASDAAWQMSSIGYHNIVSPSQKTTITDTSSYDNIWINPTYTREYKSFNEIYKFDEIMFNNDDDAAELAVSDHRPVSVIFRADLPDDDTGTGCGTTNNPSSNQGTPDVRIYSVTASPTDSEQVTLKNYSSFTADISHWTIGDKNNPTAYTIPYNTYLGPGETITFHHSTLGFGINDSGEIIYLKDINGNTIDTWSN